MEPGAPPPSGSLYGTEPVVTPPQPSSDGLDGPLGAGSSSDWFGQSFSLNLFGKSLSAGQARAVIIGLLVALVLVIVASVAGSDDGNPGPVCGLGSPCDTGWFCNYDRGDDGDCEKCLDCGSPDDSWAGCNQCGLPDAGADDCTAACSGTAVAAAAPSRPTYELTIGYCRGGPAWEEGHNGYPELWDCTPGSEDSPLTLQDCTAECNADPECGAFDIESHTASGETESECCLFRSGHTGDGSSERHCWLRSTTTAPPPPPPPNGASYALTIGYCRGGPPWEEGHAGYPELWDCTPGPENAPLTLDDCTAECNADPECGAFDIESHTASGETQSECCLFKEGHTGEGSTERHCWIRSDMNSGPSPPAPRPPPPPANVPNGAVRASYELTMGYCRGGPAWEPGHAGYPELWDCTPGPEDAPLTLEECTAECNADPECGAFDIESHTASGETESECCLFKEGHSGDGSSERHCWLRSTTTAPPPPPPPNGAAYELTIGYCRGGPAWEPGHAGYPELWDCTPGPENAPLTLEECTAECNADPECGAFDIEAHTAGGQTESECCLFKQGHRGDGAAQRHCWIRNDMAASRPALRGNAQVFSFTGEDQTVVVPDGVTRATVKLWGAGGGAGVWNREYSHSSGGGGGYTVGYLDVTPGETLIVMVGEGGYTARGMTGPSYGGGGRVMSDWEGAPNGLGHAGCGGGRSAVFQGTGTALAEIATAGGGGGGGEGLASWNDGHGGGGGGEEGRPATDNGLAYSGDGTLGGSGGTQISKGGGGTCGADDSDQHVGVCTNAPLAGSGGGGWYGGGAPTGNDKSGGGGSGFAGRLASGITIAGTDGTNLHDTPDLNMGVGVGGESGGFNDVHYAGTVGHGGAPSDGTPDVSTGAGGKGGDGMAVIIWGEDDPSGWATPAPVDLFGGPTACTAIHPGNAADECIKGVQQMDTLWRDRDYGWTTAPADILDGRWTYVRPALEVGEGAPCPNEGGFAGTLDQPAVVAICCANHCGDENTPTAESDGVALSWTIHPGTWALSGHGGEPCSFYEARLPVGTHNICCSSCWASGLFFAKAPDNAGEDSSGPLVCESLTSTVTDFTCVEGVTGSETLWADRDYAWVEDQAPSDVLDGEWTYARSSLEVPAGAACDNEGGFRGHVAEHVVVALCCANHCGDENLPTGEGADAVGAWTQHPGTFSISGHGGSPCTFYETRLQPGDYQLCCESCWASGAFFSHFHHELPVGEDDSIGSAGPMLCDAVSSSTPSECEFAVGASATLWTDRAYSWITGPTDILDSQWTCKSSIQDLFPLPESTSTFHDD
eukprot:COSAG06_NODE_1330_length_9845_cov_6.248204_2_plen_1304_part_00